MTSPPTAGPGGWHYHGGNVRERQTSRAGGCAAWAATRNQEGAPHRITMRRDAMPADNHVAFSVQVTPVLLSEKDFTWSDIKSAKALSSGRSAAPNCVGQLPHSTADHAQRHPHHSTPCDHSTAAASAPITCSCINQPEPRPACNFTMCIYSAAGGPKHFPQHHPFIPYTISSSTMQCP
jgi:hypothetical protein